MHLVCTVWRSKIYTATSQYTAAVQELRIASTLAPRHPMLVRLVLKLVKQALPWPATATIVDLMASNAIIATKHPTPTTTIIYRHLLHLAMQHQQPPATLLQLWQQMHKNQRSNPNLVAAIMHLLLQQPQLDYWNCMATTLLSSAQKLVTKNYNARLINAYGLLPQPTSAQFATIVQCLDKYQATTILLLTAGRIALHLQLWGQAKTYLQQALNSSATDIPHRKFHLPIYLALATVYQELQDHEQLQHCYRHILRLAQSCALVLTE